MAMGWSYHKRRYKLRHKTEAESPMKHPNATILEKMYADFAKGDLPAMLAACDDKITFQVAGQSQVAGKFTKADFVSGFVAKLMELTGGTLKVEVHDVLASDRHGVVLASDHFTRAGQVVQLRTVHVWRFENGKPVAWYEYPRDMYQFDKLFG
jgi:ketosteroid isomerase-like protein